jgi:hypothetical protein
MCFGRAIWLGRSLSETRCNVIAVRLLTNAVLQPIVSPLLSISWRLITPYIRPFWFRYDGTVVTLARTTWNALCAAMMTQLLYMLSCSLRLGVAAVGHNCTRASCTSWCGDARGLCAQQWFGWVTNVFDYRSNGAALCCGLIHQQRCGHPLPIVVTYRAGCCRTVCIDGCTTSGKVKRV